MESTREFSIPDTEYFVVKTDSRQTVYDCDGDVVSDVPVDWNERELVIWAQAYDAGIKRGERWGENSGEYQTQTAMLKALGIHDRISELESNVKLLASILYYHEGICKEDVASMAGRE